MSGRFGLGGCGGGCIRQRSGVREIDRHLEFRRPGRAGQDAEPGACVGADCCAVGWIDGQPDPAQSLFPGQVDRCAVQLGAEPAGVTVSDMVDAYETAFRLRSSAFNRRSVIEHLVDLGTLLDADRPLKAELLDQAQAMRQRWVPPDV